MSQICLLCRVNETMEGTHNKVCNHCYDNSSYLLERHAREIADIVHNEKDEPEIGIGCSEMNATPDDDDITEAVGTLVMGWKMRESTKYPRWKTGPRSSREEWDFCPLENWNHTMEVVRKMREKLLYDFGSDSTECWATFYSNDDKDLQRCEQECFAADKSLQRAICLAAIKAARYYLPANV